MSGLFCLLRPYVEKLDFENMCLKKLHNSQRMNDFYYVKFSRACSHVFNFLIFPAISYLLSVDCHWYVWCDWFDASTFHLSQSVDAPFKTCWRSFVIYRITWKCIYLEVHMEYIETFTNTLTTSFLRVSALCILNTVKLQLLTSARSQRDSF